MENYDFIEIGTSDFDYNNDITGRKKQLLDELLNACYRVYVNMENEVGLNDEVDDEGEKNWDALATISARENGVRSAY